MKMNNRIFQDFLQDLITLLDPSDKEAIEDVKKLLNQMMLDSNLDENDPMYRKIAITSNQFDRLMEYKEDFAINLFDSEETKRRKSRLALAIRPHC